MGRFFLNLVAIIKPMPIMAPANDEKRMTNGSIFQPNHAPIADSNLKSPYPIPSLPVIILKLQ